MGRLVTPFSCLKDDNNSLITFGLIYAKYGFMTFLREGHCSDCFAVVFLTLLKDIWCTDCVWFICIRVPSSIFSFSKMKTGMSVDIFSWKETPSWHMWSSGTQLTLPWFPQPGDIVRKASIVWPWVNFKLKSWYCSLGCKGCAWGYGKHYPSDVSVDRDIYVKQGQGVFFKSRIDWDLQRLTHFLWRFWWKVDLVLFCVQ